MDIYKFFRIHLNVETSNIASAISKSTWLRDYKHIEF